MPKRRSDALLSAAQSRVVATIIKYLLFRVNLLLREMRVVWLQSIVKREPKGRNAVSGGREVRGCNLFLYK